MTIALEKYVDLTSGVRGAVPMPWVPPVFDPNGSYVLLLEGLGALLLEDGEPIRLEQTPDG